ncbi:hypothetical protein BY457_104244 [Marinilabilia salmonicolor]|jgi:hypothetical protein|nr:hypothetical protein BY457_104244 [Marinilabilia salmonicolor]
MADWNPPTLKREIGVRQTLNGGLESAKPKESAEPETADWNSPHLNPTRKS